MIEDLSQRHELVTDLFDIPKAPASGESTG